VLSADIVGSTRLVSRLDPEEALVRLEPALAVMRSAVHRNRGTVSREQGDGLVALFGAPSADEHHAAQACYAALDLVRGIEQLHDPELRVRVGVHSGEVVAHFVEDDFSSVYEAAGPVMHLVERLQSTAPPGGIHASAACRALAEGLVTFEASEITELRGFVGPVSVFRITGFGTNSRWHMRSASQLSPFVGRSAEIASLQAMATRALGSSGQIGSIIGDAGTGKSRLVHEFVDQLINTGWRVIEAECNPLAQTSPQSLLKSLLLNAHVSATTVENQSPTIIKSIDLAYSKFWKPALCDVLDQPISDTQWHALDPFLRRRITAEAVCAAIFATIGRDPGVVLIEDFHWADDESRFAVEVFASLVADRPLLMLFTSRIDRAPLTQSGANRLPLRPLDASSAHILLDWLIGASSTTEELKIRVLRHTGGVPLFIEEVVRELAESGNIAGERGDFVLVRPWDRLAVPVTVQGVIADRIDRLPGYAKTVLQIASAIGPSVPIVLLRAVAGELEPRLNATLPSLGAAELLIESGSPEEIHYHFPHDLIREVAYNSMLRTERSKLHGLILTCTETTIGERQIERAETLAYHAYHAQFWQKVEIYAHMAARKCLLRSAFSDASQYFEWSIEAVERLPDSVELRMRAIDLRLEARLALSSSGKTARWAELSREAELRADGLGDTRRKLAAAAVHAAALNFIGTPWEAVAASENVVSLAQTMAAEGWLGFAEYGLAQAYCLDGRYREAIAALNRADRRLSTTTADIPIGTTPSSLRVLCCMLAAIANVALGDVELAILLEKQATDHAAESNKLYDRIAADYSRATVRLFQGSFAEAQEALDDAMSLARRYGVRQFMPVLGCQVANLHLQQERPAEARMAALTARDEAEALGHIATGMLASTYLAAATHRIDGTEKGLGIARATTHNARQQGFRWLEAQSLLVEGTILRSESTCEAGEARDVVDAALAIAIELGTKPQIAFATALLAALFAREAQIDAASEAYEKAEGLFAAMKMSNQVESVRLAHALMLKNSRSNNRRIIN
jgi:class 3 adenylate cyclase/tetratricopeptide (TPR) repeat protein